MIANEWNKGNNEVEQEERQNSLLYGSKVGEKFVGAEDLLKSAAKSGSQKATFLLNKLKVSTKGGHEEWDTDKVQDLLDSIAELFSGFVQLTKPFIRNLFDILGQAKQASRSKLEQVVILLVLVSKQIKRILPRKFSLLTWGRLTEQPSLTH